MMTLPVPSWRTTRAIADFLRPVPKIVCAAKPPGSLDFTYILRSAVSNSSEAAATEAETTREGNLATCETEMSFGRSKERLFGLEEIWEENERDDNEDVREATETAIVEALWCPSLFSVRGGVD